VARAADRRGSACSRAYPAEVPRFVAFIRGINVGGKAKVPMGELRSSLDAAGLEEVVTYIQSGNVVLRSTRRDARKLEDQIAKVVADGFGVDAAVMVRTPSELEKIVESNPFLAGKDVSKLHVVFLSDKPKADAVAGLDPDRSPPDEFAVLGREIFLHFPNGFGRTKLTIDYFERRLGVRASARNWKTVNKMLALSQE
jgi:uncharacterized protein (DUF1697 family)